MGAVTPTDGVAMIKRRSQILTAWFLTWDILVTSVCWIGAYYLRFDSGWMPVSKETPDPYLCWRNLPLVVLLSAVAYELTDLNELQSIAEAFANWAGSPDGVFIVPHVEILARR